MFERVPYKRILLKLSGEILLDSKEFGVDFDACKRVAHSLKTLQDAGIQVGVVIGGGNIFRGINLKETGIERTPADQMGMLATLINGIALQQALKSLKCPSHVMSALECPETVEPYNWRKAMEYIGQGDIIIFVGGTGNPYFTTDTAAALRASEIQADILLKATKVDGIYDKDPKKFSDAIKYNTLSYTEALAENLKVMDATSIALCRSNEIPILVFNMELLDPKKIIKALSRENPGTLVKGE